MPFPPADLTTCYGWAYEPCGAPAVFVVREHSLTTTYWAVHGYCLKHAKDILDAVNSETDQYMRVWMSVADYLPGEPI